MRDERITHAAVSNRDPKGLTRPWYEDEDSVPKCVGRLF